MLKIGITGGIGVGKTYVSNIIDKMGYPVFAKDLVKSDYKLIESIKKEFGHDIFLNEKIDSKKLSNIVFGDSNALNKLNSIIHPFVFECIFISFNRILLCNKSFCIFKSFK